MRELTQENVQALQSLRDDASLVKLLERMPKDVQESFSEEQLANLKLAISARAWGSHAIDVRSTIKFFRYRYYYVFVAGRNRRELSRREKRIALLMQAAIATSFITVCSLLGILVLYLVKSALGIDIFPGFSFGVWGWFKETFL